jgi:hypothetical protein
MKPSVRRLRPCRKFESETLHRESYQLNDIPGLITLTVHVMNTVYAAPR